MNDDIGRHLEDHEIGRIHLGDSLYADIITKFSSVCGHYNVLL